jgi:hypothetical protein
MFKKIVQRAPVGAAEGIASQESVSVLLEVIERLREIEGLLPGNGFEPGSETL